MMTARVFPWLLTILVVGCGETTYPAFEWPPPSPPKTFLVKVVSEPPGANIELGNEYIGKTPCEMEVIGLSGATVRALPVYPGHFVQEKHFGVADRAPKVIFFDMRLGPVYRGDPEMDELQRSIDILRMELELD
jgi:hypothetical protein